MGIPTGAATSQRQSDGLARLVSVIPFFRIGRCMCGRNIRTFENLGNIILRIMLWGLVLLLFIVVL